MSVSKKFVYNKTESRIVVNSINKLLLPGSQKTPLVIEVKDGEPIDKDLLSLQKAGFIIICDTEVDPVAPITAPAPPAPNNKKAAKADPNDELRSEVTIMTDEGVKKANMSYRITGEASHSKDAPENVNEPPEIPEAPEVPEVAPERSDVIVVKDGKFQRRKTQNRATDPLIDDPKDNQPDPAFIEPPNDDVGPQFIDTPSLF